MKHFYGSIKGNMTFPQYYQWLVEQMPVDRYSCGIEIGVQFGASAACLGVEIINSGKDVALDLIDICPRSNFMDNLQPIISVIRNIYDGHDSIEAAKLYEDGSLDFVFIDTTHGYEPTKKEIEVWLPKMKKGAIMSGHDFNPKYYPGLCQAVIESFPEFNVIRCERWGEQQEYFPVWMRRI